MLAKIKVATNFHKCLQQFQMKMQLKLQLTQIEIGIIALA